MYWFMIISVFTIVAIILYMYFKKDYSVKPKQTSTSSMLKMMPGNGFGVEKGNIAFIGGQKEIDHCKKKLKNDPSGWYSNSTGKRSSYDITTGPMQGEAVAYGPHYHKHAGLPKCTCDKPCISTLQQFY